MKDRTYNLRELCREAGVTERTVRYYIKEGLLPPPHGSGPFSRYSYEHWLRLQFIKRLKDEYLPLSEIKNLLDSRSAEELDQLARQGGLIPGNSATLKGQPVAPAQTSDPLPGLIGGGGRTRMLRDQLDSAAWPVPPFAASQPNTEAFEPGPVYNAATFGAAQDTDIDSFANLPEASSLRFAMVEPPENADMAESGPEGIVAPPQLNSAPGQAKATFSPQSFRAGADSSRASGAAPASMPPGAPQFSAGARPPGGINYSTPAAPLRPMKMSRFPANEATADVAPGDFDSAHQEPSVPAPMPLMARMTAPKASAPPFQQPESAPETVTGQAWERIEVAPGVELHIEKQIADTHRPALANLLHSARRLFGPKEI